MTVAEKGKRYVLNVHEGWASVVYQVDGYIVTTGNKCDKMVLVKKNEDDWVQIFVELKGKDINHAIQQLESSLQNSLFSHQNNKEKRARIVATAFPSSRGNMTMEKAKVHFLKAFSCDLRGMKSNQPDELK